MCLIATAAGAATPVTLKIAGVLPASHYPVTEAAQYRMHLVEQTTAGQVRFEYYPAEQLGTDALALAQAEAIDMTEEPLAYVGDRMPLTGVVELLGMFETSCAGTRAYNTIAQPGTALYRNDYEPNRIYLVFSVTKRPIAC